MLYERELFTCSAASHLYYTRRDERRNDRHYFMEINYYGKVHRYAKRLSFVRYMLFPHVAIDSIYTKCSTLCCLLFSLFI